MSSQPAKVSQPPPPCGRQLYQTFYYVRGLARAYRVSFIEVGRELLLLGSREYVAFRLVRTQAYAFGSSPARAP